MHPFGLITFLQFLWEHGIPSLLVLVTLGLLLSLVFLGHRDQEYQNAPATLPHFPLSHVASFLKQRHDFFAWGFKITNRRLFQFRLLHVCDTAAALILCFVDGGTPHLMVVERCCCRLRGAGAERFL
jgi:Na+/H+ antiporter NhaD/arsenite permease-like protein